MDANFLTLDEGLALQAHQIDRYGGSHGIRDIGLLESAMAMPQASFGGVLFHGSLHEMAAAYLFHLVQNHPFIDGNEGAGLAIALTFLRLNGVRIRVDDDDLYNLVLGVAKGEVSKAAVAVFLQEHALRSKR